jgi:predicted nucleic acid-binding protein
VKIFFDTNVLASGIATRGLCAELFEGIINDHETLTGEPVLRELSALFRKNLACRNVWPRPFLIC